MKKVALPCTPDDGEGEGEGQDEDEDEDAYERLPRLCKAINLADGYRRGYLQRAGRLSGARDALGYAFIGASVLALYYAASPQPTRINDAGEAIADPDYAQRVRRMGAIGGGLYAYGQWGSSKSRDLVYLDGARAMACVVLRAAPLIPAAQDHKQIVELISSVRTNRRGLETSLTEKENLDETLKNAARQLIVDASNLIDEAEAVIGASEVAGYEVRARVDLVNVELRRRLVSDTPNFESLVALSSSLPGIARSMGSDLTPQTEPEETPVLGIQTPLADDMDLLNDSIQNLRIKLAALSRVRDAMERVHACNVGGGSQFSYTPKATNAAIEVGDQYDVVVSDPVGHPSARIAGGQTSALELDPITLTGQPHEYRIRVSGNTETGASNLPVLAIRSASGLSGADINITVTAKPE